MALAMKAEDHFGEIGSL